MNNYLSEVMPAVAAMIVMGLMAIFLFIVFETLRVHFQTAHRRQKKERVVEPPKIVAAPSRVIEDAKDSEVMSDTELRFDGDVGMFEGDFVDPAEDSRAAQEMATELAEPSKTEDVDSEQISQEPPEQIELALEHAPVESAQLESKQRRRDREAKTDRRSRKAEKQQRTDDASNESRRRRKEREPAPDDARTLRQQKRRQNRQ